MPEFMTTKAVPKNERVRKPEDGGPRDSLRGVRAYRWSPDRVMLQIWCGKTFSSVMLTLSEARNFSELISKAVRGD